MHLIELLKITGGVILAMMIILWLVSLIVRNASIVDIFWGIGFVVVVWIGYYFASGYLPRKQLIANLVTIWGARLAIHISIRNWGKPEDFRYAKRREENAVHWWWLSFFQGFLLQGFLIWIISIPLLAAQTSGYPVILTPLDLIGESLFTLGLLIESMADLQLMLFRKAPANKGNLLTVGLWKFSRHPNYFGEAMVWWGLYIIALAAGYSWTIFSPILMTYLLVKVSGVAMLEQTLKLKPGYEDYMRRTSAFIPWFPKKYKT
jgi:steroid 5-alpha reductase family enzyme